MNNNRSHQSTHTRKDRKACVRESREMREHLSERQIDQTLEDSFPASDPPAWY